MTDLPVKWKMIPKCTEGWLPKRPHAQGEELPLGQSPVPGLADLESSALSRLGLGNWSRAGGCPQNRQPWWESGGGAESGVAEKVR